MIHGYGETKYHQYCHDLRPVLTNPETEGLLVSFDHTNERVEPWLHGNELQGRLSENVPPSCTFAPEFARCQLESTPGRPWAMDSASLMDVEENMKLR